MAACRELVIVAMRSLSCSCFWHRGIHGERVDRQCVPVPPNADELHVFDGSGCAA